MDFILTQRLSALQFDASRTIAVFWRVQLKTSVIKSADQGIGPL